MRSGIGAVGAGQLPGHDDEPAGCRADGGVALSTNLCATCRKPKVKPYIEWKDSLQYFGGSPLRLRSRRVRGA